MREMKTCVGLITLALGLAVIAGGVGCSSAKAEPLEVTYYYLPG
jgi:hypothetical protein